LFVAIGTSGFVYPVAGLVTWASGHSVMAPCLGGDRSVLAPDGRLVDERCMTAQLAADALLMAMAPWQAKHIAAPFRPEGPIQQRAVPAADG